MTMTNKNSKLKKIFACRKDKLNMLERVIFLFMQLVA